jgi:acid phosphatase (class A)
MLRLLPCLAALVVAVSASTAELAPGPDFIAPHAVDFRPLVPPPPEPDSIAARGEQELLRYLQDARTPDQVALARQYETMTVFALLAPVLGKWCTPENLPRTAAVFQQAYDETRPAIIAAKSNWERKRPYILDPALAPVVSRPDNTSYPSGHAYGSAIFAVLLAAALPEHAADWSRQAALVRWSRLVAGVHYPSDVAAGRIFGEAIAREMLKSPRLQKALGEVRAELKAYRQKKAA